MKILDLPLIRKIPTALHRPVIVLSVIICAVWTFYLESERGGFLSFDPSDWLMYFIGLVASALIVPIGLGIYFYLPPLGKNRRWEKLLIVAGILIFAALVVWSLWVSNQPIEQSIDNLVDNFDVLSLNLIVFALAPTFALKVVVWLWAGVRG